MQKRIYRNWLIGIWLQAITFVQKIVNNVVDTDNHYCVGKDDNADIDLWIKNSGLTVEECIAIQAPSDRGPEENIEAHLSLKEAQRRRLQNALQEVIVKLEAQTESSLQDLVLQLQAKVKS